MVRLARDQWPKPGGVDAVATRALQMSAFRPSSNPASQSSMNASNELASTGDSTGALRLTGDLEASAGFSSLEKSRQVLVFQTIQEAISAVPPRLEATFPRVVAAYTSLTHVVDAAAHGQLREDDLARLESDVDAAGGVIAPGLWSQGDNSIAVFRAATFGALRNNFQPPVVDAALAALNARLQTLKLNDLGRVFQVIAAFFSPLTPSTSNTAKLQPFNDLDVDRQVLVFRTLQDASLANPPRAEATFSAVVAAFQAEVGLLRSACEGKLTDDELEALETSIEAAGGVLSPGTYAKGKQSISAFRAETFKALQPLLPAEVMAAAISALNARLREIRPASLSMLFKSVQAFFMPLLAQGWTSPTLQSFKTLEPHRQSLVFRTVETAISSRPDLESTIFSSAVKAICCEQEVLHAASSGKLTPSLLANLKSSIDQCGGLVAPALRSSGEGSVGEFIDTYFMALKRDMSPEVGEAAIAALNAKLQTASVSSFDDVIKETKGFMEPLITAMQHAPLQQASAATETLPPAETILIEEATLVPPLELESPTTAPEAAHPFRDEALPSTTTGESGFSSPSSSSQESPVDQQDQPNPGESATLETPNQASSAEQGNSDPSDQATSAETKAAAQIGQPDDSKKNRSFKL